MKSTFLSSCWFHHVCEFHISWILSHLQPLSLILDWKKIEVMGECRGAVYLHSKDGKKTVSAEGWTIQEGKKLCEYLKCGNYLKFNETTPDFSLKRTRFNCDNNTKHIWDCEHSNTSSNKQLSIECEGKRYFAELLSNDMSRKTISYFLLTDAVDRLLYNHFYWPFKY